MTSPDFATSEAGGVQLQALHTLAALGWRYVTREEAMAARLGRAADTLLEDVVLERLRALNIVHQRGREFGLTDAAAIEAIGRLKAAAAEQSGGLLTANARATDLIRLGTSVDMTIEGETRGRQLRFVDWGDLGNNVFHMSAEFAVERARSTDTRRPDIVLFVNGIPLAVIEVKTSAVDVGQGISQSIRNQGADEIPRLFATAQILMAANPSDPRYATVGTPSKFWSLWREQEVAEARIGEIVNTRLDADVSARILADFAAYSRRHGRLMEAPTGRLPTELDRLLIGLCAPERLLDIVRGYMLFDAGEKKAPRYQQYFGVRRTLERLQEVDERGRRRGGVVWHTQGSGKSLTMVMLAREIERLIPNARLLLVTDRVDLDDQIRDTFRGTGKDVEQATTGTHLVDLVAAKTDIVTTLIHKFRAALKNRRFRDEGRDVFLLVDESHRSQTVKDDDSLHRQMRAVFPNACYIGFTGTPLLKRERSTFDRFGGLIHSYRIDEAVADRAVVPLLYEGRHVEMTVDEGALDKWFERTVKGLSPEQVADLKRRMARGKEIRGAEPWLKEVAFDVSEDFDRTWKGTPYKGQLVAPGKREAVVLKRLLDEIGLVTSEVVISDADDREGHDEVNAAPDSEVLAFLKRVKDNHGGLAAYEKNVIRRFKGPGDPEIIIVVDKLLTGFDAPRNRVLYLSKPMKEHGLLQAIARVNRLFESDGEEKENGRIVDYAGVLGDLDEALTAYSAFAGYDDADVAQALVSVREETDRLPDRHAALLDLFKGIGNAADQEAYERHLADEVRRRDFYDRLRVYAFALSTAFSSEDFIARTSERQISNYKSDLKRFEALRRAVFRRYADGMTDIDYRAYEARIRKLLDRHISAAEMTPLVPAVDIFDEDAFKRTVEEQTGSVASVADTIASATARTITERMEEDPILYKRFSELIQEVIDEFRAGRLSERDYFERVKDIREQVVGQRAAEELPESVRGDELAGAIYRFSKEAFAAVDPANADAIAADCGRALSDIVRAHRRVGWQHDRDVENDIRNAMDDYLYDEIKGRRGLKSLDADAMDDIMDRTLAVARRQLAS